MAGRQGARSFLFPDTLVGRRIRADPAEFGIVGIGGALGRKQHDLRALRIQRLAIFLQSEIVELGALERDRAVEQRAVDRHALTAGFQRRRAGHVCGRSRHARHVRGFRRGLRLRLYLMRQRGLPRLIGFHLRGDHEILPAEDHQRRQGDGEEHIVAIAVHEPIFTREDVWGRDRNPTSRRAR